MKEPKFWYDKTLSPFFLNGFLLWTLSFLFRIGVEIKKLFTFTRAVNKPVICIGNLNVEGEIMLKNHSSDTLYFSAVLDGSNFIFLSPENNLAPDIYIEEIELLPNEKYPYKLIYSTRINSTVNQVKNAVINRIASFKIKDTKGRERNIGYEM